jgi:thiosulfate dehydrogenase
MLTLGLSMAALFAVGGTLRSADVTTSPGTGEKTTVSLCDGESRMTITDLKPGEVLSRERATVVAKEMMQVWRQREGEMRWASWVAEAEAAQAARPSTAASPASAKPAAPASGSAPALQAPQPTKFTARDQLLWKREQDKVIQEGYKLFHSPTALGGTIGVSCDMCHPNGTNTHPETYPKYQVQLKKVALLRDMVNWCIENPEKGKPIAHDDPRMIAVEAYILSERKGVAIEPGKH